MIWPKVVAFLLILFLLATAGIGFFFASFSMGIRRQTLEEARKWQEEHYDLSWYDPLKKESYTVSSYDGYVLHVQLLKNPAGSDQYVLISHGYTDNRYGALKYAKMYLDFGFNVIVYDLRGHGENEKTFCTYSIRESRDLIALIGDSRARYPEASALGIHGESLGAASSLASLKDKPEIDFVVADCGFSEISSVLQTGLKMMHLPASLVNLASFFAKIRYGYSYSEMRPIDSLKENEIPILFLHGEKDNFIVPKHSEKMSMETRGYREFYLIPEAGHAASILTEPEQYQLYVGSFLRKIGVI